MKNVKRLVSLMLALLLVAAMGSAAFAAPAPTTYSITLNGTKTGENYQAIKIFDMTYDPADPSVASYTIAAPWETFFTVGNPGEGYIVADDPTDTLNSITVPASLFTAGATGNVTAFINITETNKVDFAEAARTWSRANVTTTNGTVVEQAGADTTTTITLPNAGYWMVFETSGTLSNAVGQATTVVLTNTNPTATLTVKTDANTPEKTAISIIGENGVMVGSVIDFQLDKVRVASSEGHKYHYQVFEDTMTSGLTFQNDVVIKVGDKTLVIGNSTTSEIRLMTNLSDKTQFGVYGAIKYNTDGFKLILNTKALNEATPSYKDAQIVITYSAVVNDAAADLEHNTLSYGNGGSDDDDWEPDPDIPVNPTPETIVYTWMNDITVDKYVGTNTAQKLADVGFTLVRKSVKGLRTGEEVPYYLDLNDVTTPGGNIPTNTLVQIVGYGRIAVGDTVTEYYQVSYDRNDVFIPKTAVVSNEQFPLTQEQYLKYTYDTTDPTKVVGCEWVTDIAQATELKTDNLGALTFISLTDGVFYLRETTTPAGYNPLTGDVEITLAHTVDAQGVPEADHHTEAISNNQGGGMLPGTGGIGTTLFYVLGGVLLVGASILLVTRRLVRNEN